MEKVINVQFTPEKKDYIRATRVLALKSPGFLVLAIILAVLVVASAVVLIFPQVGEPSWNSMAWVTLLIGVFYAVYFAIIVPVQFNRSYKSNVYLQKQRTFIISDEQMEMTVGDRSTAFDWQNFQKVIDGGDFFLMIYKAQQRIYPFIPKDAFTEEGSLDTFLGLLKEKNIPVK